MHIFQCDVFQAGVFQQVCGVTPAAGGGHVPGFWYDEHRKIKEREEREPEEVVAPITALSKIPELIAPPKVYSEVDELDELLELMEMMDANSRLS